MTRVVPTTRTGAVLSILTSDGFKAVANVTSTIVSPFPARPNLAETMAVIIEGQKLLNTSLPPWQARHPYLKRKKGRS